jgi:hypothetical protein
VLRKAEEGRRLASHRWSDRHGGGNLKLTNVDELIDSYPNVVEASRGF